VVGASKAGDWLALCPPIRQPLPLDRPLDDARPPGRNPAELTAGAQRAGSIAHTCTILHTPPHLPTPRQLHRASPTQAASAKTAPALDPRPRSAAPTSHKNSLISQIALKTPTDGRFSFPCEQNNSKS